MNHRLNVPGILCMMLLFVIAPGIGCSEQSPSTPAALKEPATTNTGVTSNSGQSSATEPTLLPWFENMVDESGIDFMHVSGHRKRHNIPEITCGGAAVFDMDNDGDLDVYLVQSGRINAPQEEQPPNQLYRNRGDGIFDNVTKMSGADDRGYGCGVAVGDYDNDGDLDLYVTNIGPNILLRNDGVGVFTDVTDSAKVGHRGYGSSATFVDYDNDGDLDLFVLNYLNWSVSSEIDCFNDFGQPDYCTPNTYRAPALDTLYRNNGDNTFTDITEEAGIAHDAGTGLGVICSDFNDDGWVDIFVANDGMEDHLWINAGDGTFRNEAMSYGVARDSDGKAKAGMGVAASDIDFDGDEDLIVCNLTRETDSCYVNQGSFFRDVTARSGLARDSKSYTRFGVGWIDFNNDGFVDLYQANGRVGQEPRSFSDSDGYAEPNLLLEGKAGFRFTIVQPRGGVSTELIATSRAAVFGDLDNDGGVDVLVVNRDAQIHLLRNVVAQRGNWIMLRVHDEHGRDAFGAKVTMKVGSKTITRTVRSAYSYCAANDPRVHVGLGEQETVMDVRVKWVGGQIEEFGSLGANQIVTIRCGDGKK